MKTMKTTKHYFDIRVIRFRYILVSIFIIILSMPHTFIVAQDTKGTAVATGKHDFKMRLNPVSSNGIRSVEVVLSKYENGKTLPVDNLSTPLLLYVNEIKKYDPATGTGLISKARVNKEGEATLEFPVNFNKITSNVHAFTFIVKTVSDPIYQDMEEVVTVNDAKATIEYNGKDSIKTMTAHLYEWKDNAYVPVPEAELKLCIKRTFNYLPMGDEGTTTAETGMISAEVPNDVPGNSDGTITLAARLEEHDSYGTLEVTQNVPWSVLPKKNPERGRTLWSPGDNAPWLLVITSLTIIIIIWGTIIYLIYLLIQVKKLGNSPKLKPN
jgi:hypothetical protein